MSLRAEKKVPTRLMSASIPVPGVTSAGCLELMAGQPRVAWFDADGSLALVGFGIALELKAWGLQRFRTIERAARRLFDEAWPLENIPEGFGPRLFGGFAFRDDFVPDNTWSVFSPAHFILPHFQVSQKDGKTWLTVNALLPEGCDWQQEQDQLLSALDMRYQWFLRSLRQSEEKFTGSTGSENLAVDVRYPMTFSDWSVMIGSALDEIKKGELSKVVLARMCEIWCDKVIDVDDVLAILTEKYASCYRFLFEPSPFHAFIGATPELLASVQDRDLTSMALAGSICRGGTPSEDAALSADLLRSEKDRYEHAVVVNEMKRRLFRWCEQIDFPAEPEVLKLGNIQHLHTPITAQLTHNLGVLPVVGRLHPTPALGGVPRQKSLAFIRRAEPVTRGWYAAPVGWVDAHLNGKFGVAIRSAVMQNERAWLYAGAGIVADSQPQKEWEETALKFRPVLQALGLESEILMSR